MDEAAFSILIGSFVGLIVCGVVGYLVGASAGYGLPGFFWGLLLGPIGWIIAVVLAGQKARAEDERKREEREIAMDIYRRNMEQRTVEKPPGAPSTGGAERYGPTNAPMQVARDGEILGRWTERQVQQYLWEGNLAPADLWYDAQADVWRPMDEHPRISM